MLLMFTAVVVIAKRKEPVMWRPQRRSKWTLIRGRLLVSPVTRLQSSPSKVYTILHLKNILQKQFYCYCWKLAIREKIDPIEVVC